MRVHVLRCLCRGYAQRQVPELRRRVGRPSAAPILFIEGTPDRAVTPCGRWLGVGASLQGVPQLPDFIPHRPRISSPQLVPHVEREYVH